MLGGNYMISLENAITGNVIVYQAENESVSTNVLYKDETFWMTQKDMSKLFDVNPQAISKHLSNIYAERELENWNLFQNGTSSNRRLTYCKEAYGFL